MTVIRAFLAVVLLVGFYLVGLGSVVVLGWLSFWLWWTAPGQLAHDASYAMLVLAFGLAVALWRVMRVRPTPPPGAPLTEEQAPRLWSLVRELAVAVGTRPPDEIRLDATVNAGIWEDGGLVGLRPGRRYLYLGAPLLECITVSQLRAVLAHELGHYAGGHTLFGAPTYRGMRSIEDTLGRLGRHSLAGVLLAGYAMVYALVAVTVMRRMEVEADRAAVRVAGREAMRQALGDLPRLSTAWEAYLDGYVGWGDHGYTAAEVLAYFGKVVEWRAPQRRWVADGGNVAQTARTDIVEALNTGDLDGRAMALGGLLWGTELDGSVLGWRSAMSRFWLGRVSRRDRLAVAIRTVMGFHMRLPYTSS